MTNAELRRWRVTRGLTQVQLAERLGVTSTTVARWERGEMEIAQPTMLRLALERMAETS